VIEDSELREVLRSTAERATLPSAMPLPMRRKVALRRARRIGIACLTAALIVVGGLQGMRAGILDEAAPGETVSEPEAGVTVMADRKIRDARPGAAAPEVPYAIDLTTRAITPLPEVIIGSLATGNFDAARFTASPDGSSLAFIGEGDDGSPQIFVSGIEGTDIRQVTHDPKSATSPAWSPDGKRIAYVGYGSGEVENLFVLDVATGEATQITEDGANGLFEPQFTPDGSSVLHTDASPFFRMSRAWGLGPNLQGPRRLTIDPSVRGCCGSRAVVRTVPVTGGESTLLLGRWMREGSEELDHWSEASMSPDGSLITFVASGYLPATLPEGAPRNCDRCRFLADADGTDKRIVTGWSSSPAGTWSPDGTRIVVAGAPEPPSPIIVVDAVTGEASMVADGSAAVWLDDHTLLVDV
jgi:WD40-like Beta Propeller Repeat